MKISLFRARGLASTVMCGSAAAVLGHSAAAAQPVAQTPVSQPESLTPASGANAAGAVVTPDEVLSPARVATADGTPVSEVVVTGSRIAHQNFNAPVPVAVIDARAIEATGRIDTGDILRQLPQAGISGYTPTNSNFLTGGNGISTVNLRNLTESRTLVLVNGRRFVPGVVGSQAVDFNDIPPDIIERIDVVTGGASAVYGSDALAGVINIITKRNVEGLSISGQYGESQRGDDTSYKTNITAGTSFREDKGHASLSFTYDSVGLVTAAGRGLIDGANAYNFGGGSVQQSVTGVYSGFPLIGRALIPTTGAFLSRVLTASGAVVPFSSATYGFNREAYRNLQVPFDQKILAGQVDYQFAPALRFFAEINYANSSGRSTIEPTPLSSAQLPGDDNSAPYCSTASQCIDGIPLTSASVPDAIKTAVRAANPGVPDSNLVVGFYKRLGEIGDRGQTFDRNTYRVVTGFDGDLGTKTQYEISFNYGRTDDFEISNGNINSANFAYAVNTMVDPSGTVVCVDPVARAAGCAPLNVFGVGAISQAAATYVKANTYTNNRIEEVVGNAFVRGELIDLPAGPLSYAAGMEYRLERSTATPDPLTQAGLTSSNALPKVAGSFNVGELFGELSVPVLRNTPFVHALSLNLSGRYSDYSTSGNTLAYAASVEFQPFEWVKFRAQYARAIRAPNVSELYQPASQNFPSVKDPCAGATRTPSGQAAFRTVTQDLNNPGAVTASPIDASTIGSQTAMTCLSDPAVAARVTRDGSLALTQSEYQGVSGFDGGNADLQVEKSTSYTAGFLLNYRGNRWTAPLTFSADFYAIKIQDAITTVGEQIEANQCYSAATYNPASQFCAPITRFAAGTPDVGALQYVNNNTGNFGSLFTHGIDVQLSYRLNIDDLIGRGKLSLGSITATGTYTYLIDLEQIPYQGAPKDTYIVYQGGSVPGQPSTEAPRNSALLGLVYDHGPLELSWTARVVDAIVLYAYGNQKLPAASFHDAQVRYNVTRKISVFFGVDNIFDTYVPVGGTNGDVGQTTGWTTFADFYDGLGRRFYGGVRARF